MREKKACPTKANNFYKRQQLLSVALIFSLLFVIIMRENRPVKAIKLYQPEPMLIGRTIQSMTVVEHYDEPCKTVYDATMYEDEQAVICEGRQGLKQTTSLVSFFNGRQMDSQVIEVKIMEPAVAKEVHIGTKERPQYVLPLEDYILTSEVGPRWGTHHDGVDMAVPVGTLVSCTADGTVIQAGWYGGYGNCVTVEHEAGIISRYGHLSEITVVEGQKISQGEILGYSGNTGHSTGPHLHFEMRENDVPVNPFLYVETDDKKGSE